MSANSPILFDKTCPFSAVLGGIFECDRHCALNVCGRCVFVQIGTELAAINQREAKKASGKAASPGK